MKLQKTLIITILLSLVGIISWETYWRFQGYNPTLDDNKDLWAVERAKVDKASNKDVLLTGSSRVLFDIQLDEWEKETGKRPIQLASAGSTPLPIFSDIVNNTDFTGTIIVGVTSFLFFSTTFPLAPPWDRAQTRADFQHDRTYAQRLNHLLSIPLQNNLAFLINFEEKGYSDEINLRGLMRRIKIGNRLPEGIPPFHEFSDMALDRNTQMRERTVTDTAFANTIKRVWGWYGGTSPPADKESTMAFFVKDAKKFIARGGNLILLRCPSSGGLRVAENHGFPRNEYWDDLLIQTGVKAYHFEDYEQLKKLECPEWSHLSADDAQFFTTELAKIMLEDGAIANQKIN